MRIKKVINFAFGGVALISLSAFGTAQAATFTNYDNFLDATTEVTTIDFEGRITPNDINAVERILTATTIGGVTFSATKSNLFIVDRPQTGPLYTGTGAILATITDSNTITAALPSGATAFGVDLLRDISRAYGFSNPYTISFSTGESFNVTGPTFFGFTSDTPFTSVSIFSEGVERPTSEVGGQLLDNFTFGQAKPIPEPASILGTLVFAALGGKKLLKRKQEKTAQKY